MIDNVLAQISSDYLILGIRIVFILIVGYLLISLFLVALRKALSKNISRQHNMIIRRVVLYTGIFTVVALIFSELGIKITTILGAAGILGVVIGIASQTSLGNIVSGIFLVSEKSFELGDVIRIGDKTGTVHSIDLLSIKLKTFDNLLIRIPNQKIISDDLVNLTKFPIRRIDFNITISYDNDLEVVKDLLFSTVKKNSLCLMEPAPAFIYQNFGQYGIEILLTAWAERKDYFTLRMELFKSIKEALEENKIKIPVIPTSTFAGKGSKPNEIKIITMPNDTLSDS